MITLLQYSLPSITRFMSSVHELVMLANAFPDGRHIIGIDLAEGIVDLANSRCKEASIRLVQHEVQVAITFRILLKSGCIDNVKVLAGNHFVSCMHKLPPFASMFYISD